MIKFLCPGCPAVYSVEDDKAWQKGACPACKAEFIVPGDEPEEMPAERPNEKPTRMPASTVLPPRLPRLGGEKRDSKRIVAAITALLIGEFGVHKFVLGYTRAGLITLALTVATCGVMKILTIIEGIIYLTKSDTEFVNTYQVGTKEWF